MSSSASSSHKRCSGSEAVCAIQRFATEAPQSPWQKGTVENTNGRVRHWLPRELDPKTLTTRQINAICQRLNSTPRKCPGYQTLAEVFRQKLMEGDATLP